MPLLCQQCSARRRASNRVRDTSDRILASPPNRSPEGNPLLPPCRGSSPDPRRGSRNVATGGAQSAERRTKRNPWTRMIDKPPAPDGAEEAPGSHPVRVMRSRRRLPPPHPGRVPHNASFPRVPFAPLTAGELHSWLQSPAAPVLTRPFPLQSAVRLKFPSACSSAIKAARTSQSEGARPVGRDCLSPDSGLRDSTDR